MVRKIVETLVYLGIWLPLIGACWMERAKDKRDLTLRAHIIQLCVSILAAFFLSAFVWAYMSGRLV